MSERTAKCVDCGKEFDPRESLMGEEGQCQLCWEEVCNKSWWAFMKALDERDGRVFLTEAPAAVQSTAPPQEPREGAQGGQETCCCGTGEGCTIHNETARSMWGKQRLGAPAESAEPQVSARSLRTMLHLIAVDLGLPDECSSENPVTLTRIIRAELAREKELVISTNRRAAELDRELVVRTDSFKTAVRLKLKAQDSLDEVQRLNSTLTESLRQMREQSQALVAERDAAQRELAALRAELIDILFGYARNPKQHPTLAALHARLTAKPESAEVKP